MMMLHYPGSAVQSVGPGTMVGVFSSMMKVREAQSHRVFVRTSKLQACGLTGPNGWADGTSRLSYTLVVANAKVLSKLHYT